MQAKSIGKKSNGADGWVSAGRMSFLTFSGDCLRAVGKVLQVG